MLQKNDSRERYVRCKICVEFPSIVKINLGKNRIPVIATKEGTRNRRNIVEEHFQSIYHQECKKAKLMQINVPSNNANMIESFISKANTQLKSHMSKLFCQVFVDAKRLTISAYSWPARYVAFEAGNSLDFENPNSPTIPSAINLQYVSPASHLDILSTIVKSNTTFHDKIKNAIACSIRMDGSVDRTQIDKIYIMLKIINANGMMELLFLGIGQQKKRRVAGMMEAVTEGILENMSMDLYTVLMRKISSICTDGTNLNLGEKGGLWKYFEDEQMKLGSVVPLTKIWCSAHRMQLVWGDVSNSNRIINKALSELSSISSYFHESAMRTESLKAIAEENNVHLSYLPKLFEIRWTEFSHTIINNILRSWHALVLYFEANKNQDKYASGHLTFLKKAENLRVLAFLADLLQIFSRYQQKLQSDKLTLVDLVKNIRLLRGALQQLQIEPTLDGWEEIFSRSIERENDDILTLKGIRLIPASENKTRSKTAFSSSRESIINQIIDRISERFVVDESIVEIIEPFVTFQKDVNLRKVHEMFGSDLELSSLQLQYNEVLQQNIPSKVGGCVFEVIKSLISKKEAYEELICVLSRIVVCTPHSADVERCISANNRVKTPLRNRVSVQTETKYLHVKFNMPALEAWNPRAAIDMWLNEKQRREHQNLKKASQASHFKGIFNDASSEQPDGEERVITKKSF